MAAAIVVTIGLGNPLGRSTGDRFFPHSVTVGSVTVQTATDDPTARATALELDTYLQRLARGMGVAAPEATVRILPSQSVYARFCRRHLPGFDGRMEFCYSTTDRIAYGYHDGGKEIAGRLRHELFHHFVNERLPGMALWANEGGAELMESFALNENGQLTSDGLVQNRRMQGAARHVARSQRPELNDLPRLTARDFYGRSGDTCYSLSYAVLLYLHRQGRVFEALRGGSASVDREDFKGFATAPKRWSAPVSADGGSTVLRLKRM
ncbi:MAG: hypothetical protein PF961_06400 [Planctomycetota bacterium]|nr:hypothetical protein [Planctomycetota bacterium]